jgi:hypothetical protein
MFAATGRFSMGTGNLYLLDLVATGATASQATVEKHAIALKDFFRIMLDLGLNFKLPPKKGQKTHIRLLGLLS